MLFYRMLCYLIVLISCYMFMCCQCVNLRFCTPYFKILLLVLPWGSPLLPLFDHKGGSQLCSPFFFHLGLFLLLCFCGVWLFNLNRSFFLLDFSFFLRRSTLISTKARLDTDFGDSSIISISSSSIINSSSWFSNSSGNFVLLKNITSLDTTITLLAVS